MRVPRVDRARLRTQRLENGYLRADAQLTRPGVFVYRNPDGSERLEYRPPEEVFAAPSLDSAKLIPVTNEHPPVMLNSLNTSNYRVGQAGENIENVDGWVQALVQIDHEQTISDIRNGKTELSTGYTVDLDETPGVTPDGQHYDAVQRNIRYNHVSVVERGRVQGSRILITDAAEQVTPEKEQSTVKFEINGVRLDVEDAVADAIEAERASAKAKLDAEAARADAAEAEVEKQKARADAAESEAVKEKERADKAESSDELQTRIDARLELERVGRTVLDGKDVAKMDDAEIMRAVILKDCPEAKLDDASDVYLRARFDHVVQAIESDESGVQNLRQRVNHADGGDEHFDEDDALDKLHEKSRNRWKEGL